MKKIIILMIITGMVSCTSSRPLVQEPNGTADTIYVDKVMMASKNMGLIPVKAGYIIHKGGKYYLHGREVSYWQYIPTNRKHFAPHSKPNGND